MSKDKNTIYYVPPIRSFEDTGFVTHGFQDGSTITSRVVPSGDTAGFAIELVVKSDSGQEVCNFTMDRFAALCMAEGLIRNLMNQEELLENEFYKPRTVSESSETVG